MPLILNVNVSKKVGEPNYGFRGASVSLQQELDTSLIHQPQQLQTDIRALFEQAREAVEAELFRRDAASAIPLNGSSTNGNAQQRSSHARGATISQVRALQAIANSQQIDLKSLLDEQYQRGCPEDLSLQEASQLIDALNG
ncbi:hypothetical protein OAE80_03840 [Planctomycetaceae bacterium]|nr:hypothetical protein [Planctomycetaceae bacterium]